MRLPPGSTTHRFGSALVWPANSPRPPEPPHHASCMRIVVLRFALSALVAGLGARASSDALAPPQAAAQGIFRVHLPWVANRTIVPGHAEAPGPLVVGRARGHTLTRLDDGRVLVVGGSDAVELWDPRDRRSRLVDPLPRARSHHVAVRLRDGQVLVAGGQGAYHSEYDDQEPLASALVFDPASASWRSVAPMAVARREPVAALLPDGRVLVAGGESGTPDEAPIVEVFAPEEGAWRPYSAPRHRPSALEALPDGRVLALNDPIVGQLRTEILDPVTTRWSEMPLASTLNRIGGHVGLGELGVLVFSFLQVERFDGGLGRWAQAAPPPANMTSPTATLLPDGTVLFVGSVQAGRAYRYDPVADRWSAAGYSEHVHHGHASVLLADGRVLLTGGNLDGGLDGEADRVTELFDPGSGSWTASWPAPLGRDQHTATVLPSGAILLVGGMRSAGGGFTRRPAVVAPDLTRWVATDPQPTEVIFHAATALEDGRVLVTGGDIERSRTTQAILFDPVTMRWRPTTNMGVPRAEHASVRLLDGSVLIAGRGTAERFDPATERWQPAGAFEPLQVSPRLVRMDDGNVLMLGGRTERSSDRYDPNSGTWQAMAPLPADRDRPSTTLLHDGRVFVVGGCCTPINPPASDHDAFLFDPQSETWSRAEPPFFGYLGAPAFTLPDGSVLILGGWGAYDAAERYDPRTDTWRQTGPLNEQRARAAAAQRDDGTVVVTGGCCNDATGLAFTNSEWYDAAANAWQLVEAEVVIPRPGVGPMEAP